MVGYRSTLAGGGNYSYTAVSVNPNTGVRTAYDSSCANMFQNNTTFNSPVVIGNNINNCAYMFDNCKAFNQNVVIPNRNNISLSYTFRNCHRFNQNVQIPENVDPSLTGVFRDCYAFNQAIAIPQGVQYCNEIFYACNALNNPISFPDTIRSFRSAYSYCTNYNQDIYINYSGTGALYMYNMMEGCTNFGKDVYIKSVNAASIHISALFKGANNSKRKNVHFNGVYNSNFNLTTTQSLVGATITWAAMTNGFYNTVYNIYCYNNYS